MVQLKHVILSDGLSVYIMAVNVQLLYLVATQDGFPIIVHLGFTIHECSSDAWRMLVLVSGSKHCHARVYATHWQSDFLQVLTDGSRPIATSGEVKLVQVTHDEPLRNVPEVKLVQHVVVVFNLRTWLVKVD